MVFFTLSQLSAKYLCQQRPKLIWIGILYCNHCVILLIDYPVSALGIQSNFPIAFILSQSFRISSFHFHKMVFQFYKYSYRPPYVHYPRPPCFQYVSCLILQTKIRFLTPMCPWEVSWAVSERSLKMCLNFKNISGLPIDCRGLKPQPSIGRPTTQRIKAGPKPMSFRNEYQHIATMQNNSRKTTTRLMQ